MSKKDTIENLITSLTDAAQKYYQGTDAVMSDSDYDAKIVFLKELTKNEPDYLADNRVRNLLEGDVAGGSKPVGNLVEHVSPMLSLGKSNAIDDVKKYISTLTAKGATGFTLQAKLDGYAISAIYKNGNLVQISTRGDGSVGQNMSYLIDNDEITIVGLPSKLNDEKDYELRGELFMRNSQFDKVNEARQAATGETFKNSRNAVVGITKKAEQGIGYHAELTFSVYTLMVDNVYTNLDILGSEPNLLLIDVLTENEWHSHGGEGPLTADANIKDVFTKIKRFGELRPDFDIPTDGVVLKPYDEAYFYEVMGHTAHHPNAFTAFKYPALTKDTVIREFTVSVGKTGRLTPVAVVDPVNIGGTTITHASCHNFNYVYTNNLRVGATVSIGRKNDVIPQIINVIMPGDNELPKVPTHCPECGTLLVSEGDDVPAKTLKCPNDECPSRLFFFMKSVVGKQSLDIDGLNTASLEGLINAGLILDVDSLFALKEDSIASVEIGKTAKGNPRKLGKARAKSIIADINRARKSTPAYKMLNSLGFLNLGPATSKKLLSEFGSIKAILSLNSSDLENVEGFSDTRINNFINQKLHAQEVYKRMLARGVIMNKPEEVASSGQSFSLSGQVPDGFSNRQAFVDHMESLGWKYDASPKKDTSIMFGDESSTSSKIVKAKKFGIKIIHGIDEL